MFKYYNSHQKKCLGKKLTKYMQNPYVGNYKTWWEKSKKIEINGKIHCVHELEEESALLRCQFSPIWSIDSMQSQSKHPVSFSIDINKLILKYICKSKGTRIAKIIPITNKVTGLILPNFKTYYKATVIKTVWY